MIDGELPPLPSYAWRTRAACIVASFFLAMASVAFGQPTGTSRALDALRSAQGALTESGGYREVRALIDGVLFADLDAERQYEALALAVRLALRLQRFGDANALLRRSSEHERSLAPDWIGRFTTGVEIEDYPDAIFALKQLAARWPDALTTLGGIQVNTALRRMQSSSRADLAAEVLETLFAGRWLTATGQEPSPQWRDLTLMRLERNDLAGAVEVAARIASPIVLIEMRVDRRFDAVVAALPARFRIDRAVDEEIESLRSAVEAASNRLQPVVQLALALHSANRLDEALSVADTALERAANLNRVSPYTDGRSQVEWLRNARATTLWTMGRHAEAADELKKASDLPDNVSQRINYASLLVKLGRGAEALPLVRGLENTSPYGDMQAAAIEVAAASQLGDRRAASRALNYLETHEADAIGALQSGFLSVRDFEAAARILIKRLRSAELRGAALVAMQDYLDAPETPHEAQGAAEWAVLLTRPDVQMALDSVGRIESHPIHGP